MACNLCSQLVGLSMWCIYDKCPVSSDGVTRVLLRSLMTFYPRQMLETVLAACYPDPSKLAAAFAGLDEAATKRSRYPATGIVGCLEDLATEVHQAWQANQQAESDLAALHDREAGEVEQLRSLGEELENEVEQLLEMELQIRELKRQLGITFSHGLLEVDLCFSFENDCIIVSTKCK